MNFLMAESWSGSEDLASYPPLFFPLVYLLPFLALGLNPGFWACYIPLNNFLKSLCMYVLLAHVYVICKEVRSQPQVSVLSFHLSETVSCPLLYMASQLAGELGEFSCLYRPSRCRSGGIIDMFGFLWVLGIWAQDFILANQGLYLLSRLPVPLIKRPGFNHRYLPWWPNQNCYTP